MNGRYTETIEDTLEVMLHGLPLDGVVEEALGVHRRKRGSRCLAGYEERSR